MLAPEVENYLSEIARMLKVGGRCFISFFLLNPESLELIAKGQSTLDLKYDFGPAKSVSRESGFGDKECDSLWVVVRKDRLSQLSGLDRGRQNRC